MFENWQNIEIINPNVMVAWCGPLCSSPEWDQQIQNPFWREKVTKKVTKVTRRWDTWRNILECLVIVFEFYSLFRDNDFHFLFVEVPKKPSSPPLVTLEISRTLSKTGRGKKSLASSIYGEPSVWFSLHVHQKKQHFKWDGSKKKENLDSIFLPRFHQENEFVENTETF